MNGLRKFLSSFHKIDRQVLENYVECWSEYAVKKKTVLTRPNETERYLYFIENGIQKSYYLNNGKQHVMFFAYAPSLSGIVESFLTQTPSNYFIETITDSNFVRINYERHHELLQKHRELETLFRKITETMLAGVIEKQHELLAFSVEERFRSFVKRSPHLLNMVPQKDIASYLRIDSTNFSKLMNSGMI
jgi:CRP-like cAMP-binding protein